MLPTVRRPNSSTSAPHLAVHFGEVEMNGNIYRMEPGRMVFGEKNARTGE